MKMRVKLADVVPHLGDFGEGDTITDEMVAKWEGWETIRYAFRTERAMAKHTDLDRLIFFINTEAYESDFLRRYSWLKANPKNAFQKGYITIPEISECASDFIVMTPNGEYTADLKYHKPGLSYIVDRHADITIYYTPGASDSFIIAKTHENYPLDQLQEVLKNGLN